MTLLNWLFGTTESTAIKLELEDETVVNLWKAYLKTVPEKEKLIAQLPASFGQRKQVCSRLKELFDLELIDLKRAEKDEKDLLPNLEVLKHSQKIRRIHRLEHCLAYAETKYKYVHELLAHLYYILKSEFRLWKQLSAVSDIRKFRKIVVMLNSEFEVEKTIIKKIGSFELFHNLFAALVRGEHIVQRMDAGEKKLLSEMQMEMKKIFAEKVQEGIIFEWTLTVFNAVQDIVMDPEKFLALGYDQHQDIDFEFVNRPSFVDFTREKYPGKTLLSPQMLNVFVHLFREWYNHQRD